MGPGRNPWKEPGSTHVWSEVEATWNEWKGEWQSRRKDTGFIAVGIFLWAKLNNEYWCLKKSVSCYSAAFTGF